jgi:hypothetical protein
MGINFFISANPTRGFNEILIFFRLSSADRPAADSGEAKSAGSDPETAAEWAWQE